MPAGDHGHVQMDADGLGVHGDHAVLVDVAVAVVRLQMQVGLTGAVALDLDLLLVGDGIPVEVGSLDAVGLIEDVGGAGVDLDGVGRHGVQRVHVGGQLLDLHLHGVGRGAGMGLGVGGHDGDGVAELEDLVGAEDRALKAVGLVVLGQHDQTVDLVGAAGGQDVLVGDDLHDAGHLLGLGGVDGLDVGVGDLGLGQGQTQAAGHLQRVVSAEVPGAGDLLGGGGTDVLGALDAVAGGLEDQVFLGHLAAQHGGGVHGGVDEGLVAGAAAEVALLVEPVADLLAGGAGIVLQQDLGADDEAGRAEAALGAAVGHPGHLQRVHVAQGADALDGGDLGVVGNSAHLVDAGLGDLAVHDDVAGAAVALAAADLAAGQQQVLTQDGRQGLVLVQDQVPGNAVDDKRFLDHVFSSLLNLTCMLSFSGGAHEWLWPPQRS